MKKPKNLPKVIKKPIDWATAFSIWPVHLMTVPSIIIALVSRECVKGRLPSLSVSILGE